jgi:hypothetical protein
MVAIWSPETRFRIWFEIEAHACDALAELGVIPKEAAKTIWEKGGAAKFDVDKIDEIERVTKHDVIAFLTHLAEFVGPDARFIHQGMTSSDVLDTCLAVQLSRASDILLADIDALLAALKRRCLYHWVDYPNAERELEIVRRKVPQANSRLSAEVVSFIQKLRQVELFKAPGVAETIDWAGALTELDKVALDPETVSDTIGVLLKYQDDIARIGAGEGRRILDEVKAELAAAE